MSIARALLKNPPILILDEATSSLDTKSEKLVQDAILKLMKNRTSIIIAHRLSTIKNADEICVIQDGEIAERGSHGILLLEKGTLSHLIQIAGIRLMIPQIFSLSSLSRYSIQTPFLILVPLAFIKTKESNIIYSSFFNIL